MVADSSEVPRRIITSDMIAARPMIRASPPSAWAPADRGRTGLSDRRPAPARR